MKSENRKTVFKVDAREHTTKSATGKSMAGFGKATIECVFITKNATPAYQSNVLFPFRTSTLERLCVWWWNWSFYVAYERKRFLVPTVDGVAHAAEFLWSATAQSPPPSAACTHTETERDNLLKRPLILLAAASAVEWLLTSWRTRWCRFVVPETFQFSSTCKLECFLEVSAEFHQFHSSLSFIERFLVANYLHTTPDARLFVISKMYRGIALIETCRMLASLIRSENV